MWKRFLIVILLGMLVTLSIAGGVAYTLLRTSNDAPRAWVTTRTFSGQGSQHSPIFHVGDDWRFTWTCDPATGRPPGYTLFLIDVDKADMMELDPSAVNVTCQTGSTSGSVEERQGGSVYLDVGISTHGSWTVQIQEPG